MAWLLAHWEPLAKTIVAMTSLVMAAFLLGSAAGDMRK